MWQFSGIIIAVTCMVAAGAASAGNLTFSGDKSQWIPTHCTEPAMPTSLMAVDSETPASHMNELMESYNIYAGQMQEYMNCVNREAESDSSTASQAITTSAEDNIQAAQRRVTSLRQALQSKR